MKIKRLTSVSVPIAHSRERPNNEAEEEQRHQGITRAIATAASGDDVSTNDIPQSASHCEETQEFFAVNIQENLPKSTQQCERKVLDLAATRIQTAFRGYLVSLFSDASGYQ